MANDDPDKLRAFQQQQGLDFPILLDPEAVAIKAYGVFNDLDARGRLIPHPAVVIIDRSGRTRYVYVETNYKLRPPSSELVDLLEQLASESGDR